MWDILITIGNLIILPAMLGTAVNKNSYVPRFTSGFSTLGVMLVVIGLVGAGLYFSTVVVSGIAALWVFIFLFRGTAPVADTVEVTEELGVEAPGRAAAGEVSDAPEAAPAPVPPL